MVSFLISSTIAYTFDAHLCFFCQLSMLACGVRSSVSLLTVIFCVPPAKNCSGKAVSIPSAL